MQNYESKKELVKEITLGINTESKKCNSIDELISFVFSFKYDKFTIRPIQKIKEMKSFIKILAEKKPKALLEIGTARGGTLFLLCKISHPNATILSIDLPEGQFGGQTYPNWKIPLYQSFAKGNQKLHLIRSNSHNSNTFLEIKRLLDGTTLDFLLIDGDHDYEGVKQDFEMYSPLVSKAGMIVFHDINDGPIKNVGGVPKFWKELKNNYPHFEILENTQVEGYGLGILFNQKNN